MRGTIEIAEISSPALEDNPLKDPARRRTPIYLPPGYAASAERYPVVYFLHGYSGSGMGWLNTSAFSRTPPERLDDLIAGGLPPAIAVFCDGWTGLGGTQWINSGAVGRHQDYVANDVVAHVDRAFRTKARAESRALIGKSSGGYGVMAMASARPDVFGHFACHSGDAYFEYCYLPEFPLAAAAFAKAGSPEAWLKDFLERTRKTKMRGDDHPVINTLAMAAAYSPEAGTPLGFELPFQLDTARIKPEVWERWLEQDPVRFVPRQAAVLAGAKSFFVDCGTRDEFNLQWGARMVAQALKDAGVDVRHEEFDDGHMGIQYRYDRSLSFLVRAWGCEPCRGARRDSLGEIRRAGAGVGTPPQRG